MSTGRHSAASMWPCQRSRKQLGAAPAVVRMQRHAEELAELAVEVGDARLRAAEYPDLYVALRRQPLGEHAQRHRLAQPGQPGDQGKAALADELLDAPAERLQAGADVERLDRYLGSKGIPLQAVQRQQLLVHG